MTTKTDGDDGSEQIQGGDAIGTGNDARLALYDTINDKVDEGRGDELALVNDDDTTEPFQVAKEEIEDAVIVEQDPEVPAEPEPTPAPKVKIKVNGRELELTQEELIARAQKVEAADEYLRLAKERVKEPVNTPTVPSQEDLQRRQDEEDQALVRALQMGTVDEATDAIRKIREQSTRANPSLSRDDVVKTFDDRLAFQTAIQTFRTEYKDLVADPMLHKLVLERDEQLLQQGDTRPYIERYTEIGNEIREWRNKLVKDIHPAVNADGGNTKLEKKAGAPKVPTAAAGKSAPPAPQDDVDDNATDVIAAMQKSRGGPQWMR